MSDKPKARPWESRRHFLAAVAVVGAWPAAASAQRITTDKVPPAVAADQDVASLKARTDAADLLTVAVTINGQGPFQFVVDTGAERSVIAEEVAATLSLEHGEQVVIQGIAKSVTVATVRAKTVTFGPFTRNDVLMPLLPRATLAADGYLGLDVINGTRVTFDFKNHRLHVEQPKPIFVPHLNAFNMAPSGLEPLKPNETWLQTKGKGGRLQIVDCLVDDVPAAAFVDTGAEISVGNPALLAALKTYRKGVPDLGPIVLTGVNGGELPAEVVSVPRMNLQELSFTESILAIADAPDFTTWGLHDKPALLIGMNYLRQFGSVSVDYRAKQIRFELSEIPPMPRPGVAITKLG